MIITKISNKSIVEEKLEGFLKVQMANRGWLENILFPKEPQDERDLFPYKINTQVSASLDNRAFSGSSLEPQVVNDQSPKYIALIPCATKNVPQKVEDIFNLFKTESFGLTEEEAKAWAEQNLVIVLGINRVFSLDKEINQDFEKQLTQIPKIEGIAYKIFGFFWHVSWIQQKDFIGEFYSKEKAFFILKSLNPDIANTLLEKLEGKQGLSKELQKVINMQKIRQKILSHSFDQDFIGLIRKKSPKASLFFWSGDDDCLSLKSSTDQKGLFSHLNELIENYFKEKKVYPHLVSTGYNLSSKEDPILQLAVKIDMTIRKVMRQYFLPYFPEPNVAWKIPIDINRTTFSFMGNGTKLESLRLIQNGIKTGRIDPKHSIFENRGALITATPERMKTKKLKQNPFMDIKSEEALFSLRSSKAQLHTFSRVWTNQIYCFLDIKTTVTDITPLLSKIYSVFNPISQISDFQAQSNEGKYTTKIFDRVFGFYEDYCKTVEAILKNNQNKQEKIKSFADRYCKISKNSQRDQQDQEMLIRYLTNEVDKFFQARAVLSNLKERIKIKEKKEAWPNEVNKVILAAQASSQAIYNTILKEL